MGEALRSNCFDDFSRRIFAAVASGFAANGVFVVVALGFAANGVFVAVASGFALKTVFLSLLLQGFCRKQCF